MLKSNTLGTSVHLHQGQCTAVKPSLRAHSKGFHTFPLFLDVVHDAAESVHLSAWNILGHFFFGGGGGGARNYWLFKNDLFQGVTF